MNQTETTTLTRMKMAALFSNLNKKWILLVCLVVIAQICIDHANAGSVKFLPGFEGPLPFELETGYVGVEEGEDVQIFYYFVKSELNPKDDPLILWISGGPGCSSFSGLVYEIGPIMFKEEYYNGSLPTLLYNPNSWTKVANIIFIDLPHGTGFSYAKTSRSIATDIQLCIQAYEFMRKWLALYHPEFISNPFYVGGDSYSGLVISAITQFISTGNEADINQFINLKGYILGNPVATPDDDNYRIAFAQGMGLIPDDLAESLRKNCKGEYRGKYVDPYNIQCLKHLDVYQECTSGLEPAYILDPSCSFVASTPHKSFGKGRALNGRLKEFYCRMDGYKLSYYWANDKSVQHALHIQEGSIGKWQRCDHDDMIATFKDSRPYHIYLSKKGYRSLIYSGDHDLIVPQQSTQAWIKALNYSIVDEWRPWKLRTQIAGYTRTYSNKMTFATVKGGGHTAPEYKPEECFAMFKRWISHQPL